MYYKGSVVIYFNLYLCKLLLLNRDLILSAERNQKTNFSAYPNPMKDWLEIRSEEPLRDVRLYSFAGEEVAVGMNDARRIDVSQLPAGIYFLITQTGADSKRLVLLKD